MSRREGQLDRVMWPLPGGAGNYLRSLAIVLDIVDSVDDVESILKRMIKKFKGVESPKAARSYLRVPYTLGLIDLSAYQATLTPTGRRFLRTKDPRIIEKALRTRIAGVEELIKLLRVQPRRIGLLLPAMNELGYEWKTQSQIRHRLRWLEEVGLVSSRGNARPGYFLVKPTEK